MQKISTPATVEQVADALNNTPHVRASERARLYEMMKGIRPYEPRIGGRGQHLSCKDAYCANTAYAHGRRQLCPTHYIAFLERSNRARAMPQCVRCNMHTNSTFSGQPHCGACTQNYKSIEQERLGAERDEAIKMDALDNAETTHDLREWIKEYMT